MKIGLISDSFRLPFAESISAAAKLGVTGVQKYMTGGPFTAENFTSEQLREIRDIMDSNGLIFSAICGDLGKGFGNPELNPELIEKFNAGLKNIKESGKYAEILAKYGYEA